MQHKHSGDDSTQSFFERLYEQGGARSLWIAPLDFAAGRPVPG